MGQFRWQQKLLISTPLPLTPNVALSTRVADVGSKVYQLIWFTRNTYTYYGAVTMPCKEFGRRGGSPGLVVMGGDACSKGRGFKSRCRILDGHDIFSHWFVVKIVLFVRKRPKINKKRPGLAHFFLKKSRYLVVKHADTVTVQLGKAVLIC